MQFSVRFYYDAKGNKPVLAFLEDLQQQDPILHKLVVAGIKKLEKSERHGLPLTVLVDQRDMLFELRVGDKNIARISRSLLLRRRPSIWRACSINCGKKRG